MVTMTGAQAIVAALRNEGVGCVFGLTGAEILDIMDAFYHAPELRFILTRHEQAAAFMALGYARARRAPGVCLATAGPGATNLMTGIAAAYKGCVPVIALTGKQERKLLAKDGLQEIDQEAMYRPITRWSYMATNVEKIPEAMRKAFRVAMGNPPGPVHLDIPSDLPRQNVDFQELQPHQYRIPLRCQPADALLDRAIELLTGAQAPVLLIGKEVVWEGVTEKLIQLAEKLDIPVATMGDQVDGFPNTHRLGLGPIGRWGGWGPANDLVSHADVILALGVRFDLDLYSLYFGYDVITPQSKIIQVNSYPGTIGVIFPVEVGIVATMDCFLDSLARRLDALEGKIKNGADVGTLKDQWYKKRERPIDPEARPLKGEMVARAVKRLMRRDGVLVVEVGNTIRRIRPYLDTYVPDTYYSADGFGVIGSTLPLAMGVKVARPEAQVVALSGDGGFTMNLADIETAVRENLPVVSVVINDFGYGSIRDQQTSKYQGRYIGADFGNPSFERFAQDLGAFGRRVETPAELESALIAAFASGKPAVINAIVDKMDFD